MNLTDFLTTQASPAPSLTNNIFSTIQGLAPSIAGVFTANATASATKAAAAAQERAAQYQAAATQSWTKWIPIGIAVTVGLAVIGGVVWLFTRGKSKSS